MKKTGNSWLKVMFVIAKLFASQAVNYGRTLVVYLWSWGVEAVGEGRVVKAKWKEEEATLNLGKG